MNLNYLPICAPISITNQLGFKETYCMNGSNEMIKFVILTSFVKYNGSLRRFILTINQSHGLKN